MSPEANQSNTSKRLAVKLKPAAQQQLYKKHPWIFEQGIAKIPPGGKAGDLCIVFDNKSNQVIGIGLYDPSSAIRIKMIHHGGGIKIDKLFFQGQLERAIAKRTFFRDHDVTAYRILFGENDQFPGLILDQYNDKLVLKIYSEIWQPYLALLLDIIKEVLRPLAIIGRLSRKAAAGGAFPFQDGELLWGELKDPVVQFKEHGVNFQANLVKGHKTGFFLDHRHNRKRVGELSKGKCVLDVFSYAGGFSVHALVGGATEVTSIDISGQAIELAKANASLNDHQGEHMTVAADAFDTLSSMVEQGEQFDLVVIDPPSFAGQASQVKMALKQYGRLARLGSQLTKNGGVLVLASCSSRVSSQSFFDRCEQELMQIIRKFTVMETTFHDIDHPIGFPEGAYLKTRYYRL